MSIDVHDTIAPSESLNRAESRCQNCGVDAVGAYCPACGQKHESRISPFRQLMREVMSTVFNLDNRFLTTLKLMLRPGRLTRAYLDGQRVRYISPFRLYLLFSVSYFAIAAWVGTNDFLFFDVNNVEDLEGWGTALPRLMFVIVPAFAFILKGLYRKQLYAEHLIFSLHVHAFWYILFAAETLVIPLTELAREGWFWSAVEILAQVGDAIIKISILVYLFMSMRYVYQASRAKTFLKTFLLLVGYFAILLGAFLLWAAIKFGIFG